MMIEHYWHELPGPQWFAGRRLYEEQVARAVDGATFVELGAWKGRSASCMAVEIANSGKKIAFFTVDHWHGSLDEPAHKTDEDVINNRLFEVFQRNIEPVRDYVVPIRSDSAEAADRFEANSVDFVYIDASHTFAGVTRDLEAWWPKVRAGGTIAGDDWRFEDPVRNEMGVSKAVRRFCTPRGLPITLQPGDPIRSWPQWVVVKPAAT